MSLPRFVRQPGPVAPDRVIGVAGRGREFALHLRPGVLLVDAVRDGFAAAGFSSGTVELGAIALEPLGYVKPDLSSTPANAAYYSAPYRPAGQARLSGGALSFGDLDGAYFFHCHGVWQEADGNLSGGHILPEETVVAETATVTAFGFDGMAFVAAPDNEINFKVFGPVAHPPNGQGTNTAHALRMRPNQCLHTALETYARDHGIARARLRGGVGSCIGAIFEDGTETPGYITELYVSAGEIRPGRNGAPEARIAVALVDHLHTRASGVLKRGANPVLMTIEIALEVL